MSRLFWVIFLRAFLLAPAALYISRILILDEISREAERERKPAFQAPFGFCFEAPFLTLFPMEKRMSRTSQAPKKMNKIHKGISFCSRKISIPVDLEKCAGTNKTIRQRIKTTQ